MLIGIKQQIGNKIIAHGNNYLLQTALIIKLQYMTQISDEEALLFLLKSPKKKYIKHLIQYAVGLNLCHNNPPANFKTPLIQNFKSDMELTTAESHRLLIALSQLVEAAVSIGFNFEQNHIFSAEFDSQLQQVLVNTLSHMQNQIQQLRANEMKVGNKLVDFNWKLELQVANELGKSNIPYVTIQIQSLKNAGLQVHKMQMKGEQFMAFFANMKKIKQNLQQLVEKNQQ